MNAKPLCLLMLLATLPLIIASIPAAAETIYLDANFDEKPLDAVIGTGGPDLGEPVEVNPRVLATVRGTPMPTPCLEIQDNHDFAAGSVVFEFVDNVEVTTGIVAISCNLWFHALSPGYNFFIVVREHDGAARSFADLSFDDESAIWHVDENASSGVIGAFEVGRVFPMALVFDMDAGTYDVWLDHQLLLDDEEHGIADRGVGSVRFGCTHDADVEGRFSVDDILVSDTFTPTPVTPASWGGIKGRYR